MARPSGAGAVMAAHAPAEVAGDDARARLWRRIEFFPTPPWAARAGGELIARLDPCGGAVVGPSGPPDPTHRGWSCWEPACGAGHMAHGLGPYFRHVFCSDIHDHGGSLQAGRVLDFLAGDDGGFLAEAGGVDWIVTNPPFGAAARFVELGLARARRGVAMLCRMSWLESAGRFPLFFGETPLAVLAPFSERVAMTLGEWRPGARTATGYAWFVWLKGAAGDSCRPAVVGPSGPPDPTRAGTPVILPIPPGTKARLTRPDDARLWGARGDAPLFEGVGP